MPKFLIPILAGVVIAVTGCGSPAANITSINISSASNVVIDQVQARTYSDSIVQDLLKDNREALLSKMEVQAREYYGIEGMNEVVDQMFAMFGKPLAADYKKDEIGRKTGTGGYDKPMRKFWYVVETTKYPKGNYFIFVEVVPDGEAIASSGFAIVNFPIGVPPDMR